MPKTLKQFLQENDNEDIVDKYEQEKADERRRKARERAKEVYDAGKKAIKKNRGK